MSEPGIITREEAKEAVRRCAFIIPEDQHDAGRSIVHCFIGTMGADWDTQAALDLIDNCLESDTVPQVGWVNTLWGLCLCVLDEQGRQRTFDTVTP